MSAGHVDAIEKTAEGFENLTREEIRGLFMASDDEIDRAVSMGCPVNPDGTFRFVSVLAWTERTLGEVNGAKR